MADLPTAENLKTLASVLAPGVIILWLRARVRMRPPTELMDRLIAYVVVSSAYYAMISPLFDVQSGIALPNWLWGMLQYGFIPILLGIILGYATEFSLEYRIGRAIGLDLSYPSNSAWDFAFSNLTQGTFILVTLKDGTQIAGLFGSTSLASTSKEERDLLLDELWTTNDNGPWSQADPRRSILISGGDIRFIEIY